MNTRSNDSRDQIERAIDFLVEDIDLLTPEQVEAALSDLGLSANSAESTVKDVARECRRALGARKLAIAKQQLREEHGGSVASIDAAKAKARLQAYWRERPNERPTTLAARKGEGVSDETAMMMYRSLVELGAISPDEEQEDV